MFRREGWRMIIVGREGLCFYPVLSLFKESIPGRLRKVGFFFVGATSVF